MNSHETSEAAPRTGFDVLWEPVRIGSMEVPNRIVFTAMKNNFGTIQSANGQLNQRYVDYLEARAAGGAGAVMPGGSLVHPSGERYGHLQLWPDDTTERFVGLAEAVHRHGSKLFVQLFHVGAQDPGLDFLENQRPPFSASALPSAVYNRIPTPMEPKDIRVIVDAYGSAAAKLRDAGVDCVELSSGHGYLLHSFLSPLTNRRLDEYGGGVAGRCRIVTEVAEQIRSDAGGDFPVGIRLNFNDFIGGAGITPEIAAEIVAHLHSTGLFDYFSVSGGTYSTNDRMVPPSVAGLGTHFAEYGKRCREIVDEAVPVLVAAGVRTVGDAASLIETGAADLAGMGRALLADPEAVNKARAGRFEQTVRCVGVNQGCIKRATTKGMISCTVNPRTGREGELPSPPPPAPSRLEVLVVGGGPAGMKAAESAAERGHGVTIVDRGPELGGQLRLAGSLPASSAWLDLADDLSRAVERLGVEVRLGEEVDVDGIEAAAPDKVVLAIGSTFDTSGFVSSMPAREGIPGADLPHVIGPVQALEQPDEIGSRVVVVDETGTAMPLLLALGLTDRGHQVEVVTSKMSAGSKLLQTFEFPWVYPRLRQRKVPIHEQTVVTLIEPDSVGLGDVWGVAEPRAIGADTVVMVTERRSRSGLYDALRERGVDVERIGDCLAPREVDDAINDGFEWGLRA